MIEQIRVKTDGVPLFVEELTKSVSRGRLRERRSRERQLHALAIPATLQEALLARLDRFPPPGKLRNSEQR